MADLLIELFSEEIFKTPARSKRVYKQYNSNNYAPDNNAIQNFWRVISVKYFVCKIRNQARAQYE